ncbi:MAG TPA: hypothetical protein VH297_02070 [Gaiellaceae bacterium]
MRAGPARSWKGVVVLVAVLIVLWAVFALTGCGSGSTGIGRL